MEFTKTGTERHNPYDFWLIDDERDWAVIPAGTIAGFNVDIPICLQAGTSKWGKSHIEKRHGYWLKQRKKTVCELLDIKLSQPGAFYSSEEGSKIKLVMRVAPDALIVLRLIEKRDEEFFTVTTMYQVPREIDGSEIGRYFSSFRGQKSTDNQSV